MDSRIESHDREAEQYDDQVAQYEYYGNEAQFGLCYEDLTPGQTLLDLGIGTGLSSRLFARYGLKVTGVDGSAKMLEVCRKKGFTEALHQLDLNELPLPFADGEFDHVLASGLFHFFGDLAPMFRETARLLPVEGLFVFNVVTPERDLPRFKDDDDQPREVPTPWGVSIWQHSYTYMTKLLEEAGFDLLKRQRLVMLGGTAPDSPDMVYALYVARKRKG